MLSKLRAKKLPGFTLLELVVVIVVIGILAAIAIPTFQGVIDRAHDASAQTTLQTITRDAEILYAMDGGSTPAQWYQAFATAADEVTATSSQIIALANLGMSMDIPAADASNQAYYIDTIEQPNNAGTVLGSATTAAISVSVDTVANLVGVAYVSSSGHCAFSTTLFDKTQAITLPAESWTLSADLGTNCKGTKALFGKDATVGDTANIAAEGNLGLVLNQSSALSSLEYAHAAVNLSWTAAVVPDGNLAVYNLFIQDPLSVDPSAWVDYGYYTYATTTLSFADEYIGQTINAKLVIYDDLSWTQIGISNTISIVIPEGSYIVPGTPGNLSFSYNNLGILELLWNAPEGSNSYAPVTGYRVYKLNSGTYTLYADVPSTQTQVAAQDGTFKVAAYSTLGESIRSEAFVSPEVTGLAWVHQTIDSFQWSSVSASSDGAKIVLASTGPYLLYTSADTGASWTNHPAAGYRYWNSVASSSDGAKLIAVESYFSFIYTSNDSGNTWIEQTSAGLHNWGAVASSADGTKLVAGSWGGYIYTSTDSGNTWTEQTSSGQRLWASISSSSDGTKLVAVDNSSNGNIYTSNDSGNTWTVQSDAGQRPWASVASSSDGTKLIATVGSIENYIYSSTDSGLTWTPQIALGLADWKSVAMSSDGTKLAAAANNDYLYTSSNSGATWVKQTSAGTNPWTDIAISSDGTKMVLVSIYGNLYTASY